MGGQRLIYGGLLFFSLSSWLLNGSQASCMVMIFLLILCPLSLILSLSAISELRLEPGGDRLCYIGEKAQLVILGSCHSPLPPFQGKIQICNRQTGETRFYDADHGIPAMHAGGWSCQVLKSSVCDYLGLFHFRRKCSKTWFCGVLPHPVPIKDLDLKAPSALGWHHGTPDEDWEYGLRNYRYGDSKNAIHWKLSAKRDAIMVREMMIPEEIPLTVTMELKGTPDEIDLKTGKLLWLGEYLIKKGIPFSMEIVTQDGIYQAAPHSLEALTQAVCALFQRGLAAKPPKQSTIPLWEYPIGGTCHGTGS